MKESHVVHGLLHSKGSVVFYFIVYIPAQGSPVYIRTCKINMHSGFCSPFIHFSPKSANEAKLEGENGFLAKLTSSKICHSNSSVAMLINYITVIS